MLRPGIAKEGLDCLPGTPKDMHKTVLLRIESLGAGTRMRSCLGEEVLGWVGARTEVCQLHGGVVALC